MTPDPYPDLLATERAEQPAAHVRAELSEVDSRLLEALSRPAPPVVSAVEDEPRPPWSGSDGHAGPVTAGQGPLVPVFQEPTG